MKKFIWLSGFLFCAFFSMDAFAHMEIEPFSLSEFGPFDLDRAIRLFKSYDNVVEGDRARIRLALDRFDRAMRRQYPGDAALELAIALESLLGDSSTELTWKVSLRSALLAGGTKSERRDLRVRLRMHFSV